MSEFSEAEASSSPTQYELSFVEHLLDVWNGRIEAPSKFCVESTVQPDDEWLHSFYYFNDEIPNLNYQNQFKG